MQAVWRDSTSELSDRPIELVPMPTCFNHTLLTEMDNAKCSSLTRSKASFYGGVPSLMYAVCIQEVESPAIKFSWVVQASSTVSEEDLLDFVFSLLTGSPCLSLKLYYCFTSDVQNHHSLGQLVKWPLCYIACILNRYKMVNSVAEEIVRFINVLNSDCDKVGDRMVWEQSTRIAILLHLFCASKRNWNPPFDLCSQEDAREADI